MTANYIKSLATLGIIDPADYGAYPGGASDAAPGIQAAMNAAPPGGIVFLKPGQWLCNSNLTIPPGVQLVGAWHTRCSYSQQGGITNPLNYGTVLVNNWAASSPGDNTTPFIAIGQQAVVEGIGIFDNLQGTPGVNLVSRPFQIGANYGPIGPYYVGSDGIKIRNTTLINSYRGIRLWGALRFCLEDVQISASNLGVWVDQCWDTSQFSRVNIIPGWSTDANYDLPAAVNSYLQANLIAYRLGHVDGFQMSNCMVVCAQTGVLLEQSSIASSPRNPWLAASNICLDLCDIGIDVQASQTQGVQFSGGSITTPTTSTNNIGIRVGSGNINFSVANMYVMSQTGQEFRIAGGNVGIHGCNINSFGQVTSGTSPSILIPSGANANVAATGNIFADARPLYSWQSSSGGGTFTGNRNIGAGVVGGSTYDPNSKVVAAGNN